MTTDIFISNAAGAVFALVLGIWILSEVVGVAIIPAIRRGGARVQRKNYLSNLLVMIDWIVLFGVSFGFAQKGVAMLPDWAYYMGIAMMLLGIAVRQWSMAVLGRFFSGAIGVQKGQRVVDTGPYRLVRHPSYTGALLLQLGIGLAVQSWGALVVIALGFAAAYGHRMLVEEKVLASELGDDYGSYMKRTKRLIPFLV